MNTKSVILIVTLFFTISGNSFGQDIDTLKLRTIDFEKYIEFQLPDFYEKCSEGPKLLNCKIGKEELLRWFKTNYKEELKETGTTNTQQTKLVSDFEKFLNNNFKDITSIKINKPCLYLKSSIFNDMHIALYDLTRSYLEFSLNNGEILIDRINEPQTIEYIIKETKITENVKLNIPPTGIQTGTSKEIIYRTIDKPFEIYSGMIFNSYNKEKNRGHSQAPSYPGGEKKLKKYIMTNLKGIPIQGRIVVGIRLSSKGEVKDVRIIEGGDENSRPKLIEILKKMPNWNPEIVNGEAIEAPLVLPLNF